MKLLTSLLLLFVLLLCCEGAKKLPDYVTVCKRNDPNLSKCFRDSLIALKPYLLKGIPEFNIPPVDPLIITSISLNQEPRSDRIHFNATLTNLEFSEGQNFEVLDNSVDLDKIHFYLKLRFPHLTMKSDYRAKGRVLVFDFDSDGKAFGEFSDVVVSTSWTGSTSTRKASYIEVCKANDPNLAACWKKTFESLRPHMSKPLPEINLPQMEPMHLTEVKLIQDVGTRNLYFNASLHDVIFYGGQQFQLLSNAITFEPYYVQLHLFFPRFEMKCSYKAKGKVLLFEFDGKGLATGNFTNIVFNGTWSGTTFTKKGKEYLRIKAGSSDVTVDGISVYFSDLFPNNSELTENINQSVNDNIDLLYQDFLPVLKKTLETVITSYSNSFLATFPKDVLYPKD